MYISKILLSNWKSYEAAEFEFPAPSDGRNIVLIGAPNGYGKTSLFEAIVLGLFGEQGYSMIARSRFSNTDDGETMSYRDFLEKSLHRGAPKTPQASCSVTLVLIDDSDEPLEIQRTWHFSESGSYNRNDDVLRVYEGVSRDIVNPIPGDDRGAEDWISEYVAKKALPLSLAKFFLFDGELVSNLAERSQSAQIRMAIEGLLGIHVLKDLKERLIQYEKSKRRQFPKVANDAITTLPGEIADLSERLTKTNEKISEISDNRETLTSERKLLIGELSNYGPKSMESVAEQYSQIEKHKKIIEDGYIKLERLMIAEFALALSGKKLRKRVTNRLAGEADRERWEMIKSEGYGNLKKFLKSLDEEIQKITPKLDDNQRKELQSCAKGCWDKLWYPPPKGFDAQPLHSYLSESQRSKVAEKISEIDMLGMPEIVDLLNMISEHEGSRVLIKQAIDLMETASPDIEDMQKRLNILDTEIQNMDNEIGSLKKEKGALEAQLGNKNAELAKVESRQYAAAPALRRAVRASKVLSVIDQIEAKSVPTQINVIADEMTKAYHSMAHKKDQLKKIEIDDECNVKLIDSSGVDMRDFDLSAGEKQIFTQSLIYAVSLVSKQGFPMVIDTPLGRLDVEHRKGVLRHLVQRGHQVVLLSTNTEVVGEYLREIENHVQKTYNITYDSVSDVSKSTVQVGYFSEQENAK